MIEILAGKDTGPIVAAVRPPEKENEGIRRKVSRVLRDVREKGDLAVRAYSKRFDRVDPDPMAVPAADLRKALRSVEPEVIRSLEKAAGRIFAFHEKQKRESIEVREPGLRLTHRIGPIRKVGIYAPGGLAPYPSTVLMDAIPAMVAGCPEICLFSSPKAEFGGWVAPLVLAAAEVIGLKRVFRIGGAQAVAAMAYGTESVPQVGIIAGPGNAFVCEAKRQVQGLVKIDSLAGPSEILVLADDSADPRFVAADLIGQIEHGSGASGVLVTTSSTLIRRVKEELLVQARARSRGEDLAKAINEKCFLVKCRSITDGIRIADAIAPEHIEVLTRSAGTVARRIQNAGAIFVGPYSPEPLGDYMAGPNHVLPTGGAARYASPLNVDDFLKKTSIIQCSKRTLSDLAPDIITIAEAEGFDGHAETVRVRLENKTRRMKGT